MSQKPPAGINPTVIIGLGGTGKDVLMRVRRLIVERFGALDHMPIVGFLSLDTDDAPAGLSERFMGQVMSLTPDEKVVLDTAQLPPILENLPQYDYLADWFPPDLQGIQDLKSGAKQIRALGRLAFYMGYGDVKNALIAKIKSVTDRDRSRAVLERHGMNVDNGVNVIVVGSLCGGTGSGMLLDVAYNIKKWFKYDGLTNEVNAYLMLPGAFMGVSDRVKANGYACLKELNLYMGMGRAEGARFKARYTHSPVDAVDEVGPPFNFCYLVADQNKAVDAARVTDLQEMIAQKIALEFTSDFARYAKSNRSNLEGVWQVTPRDAFGQPQNYLAFGLASLRFPADRVGLALGARMGARLMAHWGNAEGTTKGSEQQLEQLLARHKWLEVPQKTNFYDALARVDGKALGELIPRWGDQVVEDIGQQTASFSTRLLDIDDMFWNHHREMREKTRGAGNDPKQWGELCRGLYETMKQVRKETETGLTEAVHQACADPTRGPGYALWLLGELRGRFEQYREDYLGLAKHVAGQAPKEKDLKQVLAKFDPLAETLWLKLTMQLKTKLEGELDAAKTHFENFHRYQLEDKVRELGAWMFGRLLEHLAALRKDVERVDHQLSVLAGELRGLEKDTVAGILELNYAHTVYLFDAGDVDTFYHERFPTPEEERAALSRLGEAVLAPSGGKLAALPDLAHDEERKAFLERVVGLAVPAFSEGKQAFRLDQADVAERFVAKYPDRKRQEAVLHDLSNQASPFIHVDAKQAAHKFTMTTMQRLVGLPGAEAAKGTRATQEVLKALGAACQMGPGQIKNNPDPHTLVFIQEFGAYPLRVLKGLEGYKTYYMHYLDQHLHTTKTHAEYPDLFPPDEAKLIEARRALTLGLALGLLVPDADGRTIVYRYNDRAGLADTLVLGLDEQAGVGTLVDADDARVRLLQQIETLGKQAGGPDARRTLYEKLVRYAKAMETRLGTRHPRYQDQRKALGDFIKQYLMEDGRPPSEADPAAAPTPTAHYETLFEHFWVDRVIDAAERATLERAAAGLGLTPEQTAAIEARARER